MSEFIESVLKKAPKAYDSGIGTLDFLEREAKILKLKKDIENSPLPVVSKNYSVLDTEGLGFILLIAAM